MSMIVAKEHIREALNRVFFPGEESLVYKELQDALGELDKVQIIEVAIVTKELYT